LNISRRREQIKNTDKKVQKRKTRYFGHMGRRGLLNILLLGKIEGKKVEEDNGFYEWTTSNIGGKSRK